MTTAPINVDPLTIVLVALMKGLVERDVAGETWVQLLSLTNRVRDHVGVLGLELMLNEAEGFAYLRQRPERDGMETPPRLVPRRPLSFSVSLMLALLRRRLAEADASGGDIKLVLTRSEIHDLVRHLTKGASNETKRSDKLDRDIERIEGLGFLRAIRSDRDSFEVRRVLVSFVDAQWLGTFDDRLSAYIADAGRSTGESA